ncbi:MAG: hypothetical protein PSN04_10035 [Methyloprofundus sp.]|nr:hypothetical protein [Methyloprofundus sp.]
MGLLGSIVGKSKVKSANKKVLAARETDDAALASRLLSEAMLGYEAVESDSKAFKDALYNWGMALLYLARLKEGQESKAHYQEACKKFSFCLVAKSDYLAAALDWGVALMELAPLQEEADRKATYALAKDKFSIADNIQQGVASYNFACLHALNKDFDACKASLELAKDYRNLPDEDEILKDVDMQEVINLAWFPAFIESAKELPMREVTRKDGVEDADGADNSTSYSDVIVRKEKTKVDYKK